MPSRPSGHMVRDRSLCPAPSRTRVTAATHISCPRPSHREGGNDPNHRPWMGPLTAAPLVEYRLAYGSHQARMGVSEVVGYRLGSSLSLFCYLHPHLTQVLRPARAECVAQPQF